MDATVFITVDVSRYFEVIGFFNAQEDGIAFSSCQTCEYLFIKSVAESGWV